MFKVEIDPVKSGAEALKAIAEAVKTALDAVYGFVDRRKAARVAKWTLVREAAEAAEALVAEHAETARIMTAPARVKGDLASTATLLREVVDSGKFPLAYQALQGELEELIHDKQNPNATDRIIRDLRRGLAVFEYEAFMVKHSSWLMTDVIEWISEMAELSEQHPRSQVATDRIASLRDCLNKADAWFHLACPPGEPEPQQTPAEPETVEQMVECVRRWLKRWFEHVQQTLYGPNGVTKLTARLKTISQKNS